MPIRHVVVFKWNDDVTQETIAEIQAKLNRLPEATGATMDFHCGSDLGLADGNYDFAVVADFETEKDYGLYRDNPEHRSMIDDLIAPNVLTRCAVQFRL